MNKTETFGERIVRLRESVGWSQWDLAVEADVPHLGRIESAADYVPAMKTQIELADALGVSLDELNGRKL